MTENKNKKYFIKDTSVNGLDDDLFNYADISKVLERILEFNNPPYNVAIIGKWGLGNFSWQNPNLKYIGTAPLYFVNCAAVLGAGLNILSAIL